MGYRWKRNAGKWAGIGVVDWLLVGKRTLRMLR
jgi:hypothetical protein